ncbi:N-acetylmuramoyl-L-alanine amidase [Streptomyces sp. NBC_00249]|uniref:N-acetylmuramoyl-L-alanine amidase n=1 Tax=Streptomyces sp. NBC_00249 TaxID=2975690 RepID=UPI002250D86D|nr:N-acetylmuramoyl-L-alanine amidase [Streptomyces sp. NBC_00249]MCX5197018.1 N-acetylmuramoyl-L-alanine amidase [Streptomyces sp. NBC_00249]
MRYDDSPPLPESRSSISPDRPWYTRRSTLAVAVAVLAPTCLAGWVLTQVLSGSGAGPDAKPPQALPASASASASGSASHPASADAKPNSATPSTSASAGTAPAKGPLAGRTVVIDPGHNTGNFQHTAEIDKQVDIGTARKECDTTGTATNSGYREADFSLDVSRRARALLEARGVTVRLTHEADRAFGPCIDERARIGNEAAADAVVSVHADGVSSGSRGFHVILPARVKGGAADTSKIVGPSRDLGERIAGNFARTTGSAPANYLGSGTGLVVRDDLGGLNLSTRPKVFIECGNMRDAKDAAQLTSPEWRQKAAQGIADGIVGFLGG